MCIVTIIFTSIINLYTILFITGLLDGNIGLIITQSIRLTGIFQLAIRLMVFMDSNMTSVEKILEYNNVPQEAIEECSLRKFNIPDFQTKQNVYSNSFDRPFRIFRYIRKSCSVIVSVKQP